MDEESGIISYSYDEAYDQRMKSILTKNTKEDVVGIFYVKTGSLSDGLISKALLTMFNIVGKKKIKKRSGLPSLILGVEPIT